MSAVATTWSDGLNRNYTDTENYSAGTLSFYLNPLLGSDSAPLPENSYEYVITESMVENLLACTKYGLFIGEFNSSNINEEIDVGVKIKNADGTVTYAEALFVYSAIVENGGTNLEFEEVSD